MFRNNRFSGFTPRRFFAFFVLIFFTLSILLLFSPARVSAQMFDTKSNFFDFPNSNKNTGDFFKTQGVFPLPSVMISNTPNAILSQTQTANQSNSKIPSSTNPIIHAAFVPATNTPTASTQPAAPSDVSLTIDSDGYGIGVHWKDNSDNETGFDIAYTPDPNSIGAKHLQVQADQTYISSDWGLNTGQSGLLPGQKMCFQVSAYNSTGSSAPTPWTCITIGQISSTPTPTETPTPTPTLTETITPSPIETPTPTIPNPTEIITPTPTMTPTPVSTYSISGIVFFDPDRDGIQNSGEKGYSGATVTLNNGQQSTTTDVNGYYSFTNLSSGTYVVGLTVPSGYLGTTSEQVTININGDVTQNFGIASTMTSDNTCTVETVNGQLTLVCKSCPPHPVFLDWFAWLIGPIPDCKTLATPIPNSFSKEQIEKLRIQIEKALKTSSGQSGDLQEKILERVGWSELEGDVCNLPGANKGKGSICGLIIDGILPLVPKGQTIKDFTDFDKYFKEWESLQT